jgi:hypothetical protein
MEVAGISSRWLPSVGSCCAEDTTCASRYPLTCMASSSRGLAAVAYGPKPAAFQWDSLRWFFGAVLPGQDKGDFVRNPNSQNPLGALIEVMEHTARAWAEWGTNQMTLANGADLLLTGQSEQGLAANVAKYYGIPLATLHFLCRGACAPRWRDWGHNQGG